MTKAFIFNMNGVIIDSEKTWRKYLNEIWKELVGVEIASVFRFPVGMSPENVYAEVIKHGSTPPKEIFFQKFNEIAAKVYTESPLTEGINELGHFLLNKEYRLGLVSSSPKPWIETVLRRLSFGDHIASIISINDLSEYVRPKPHPGCYVTSIDQLAATSETTIVVEDSNSGIQAAKGAGVYTIGFTAHLLPEYTQHGADVYANNAYEIIRIVEEFEKKLTG
jgi:beta-phosphoglucomutase-like phosphatase (HAD superfamily)